jgi:periplasmic protein TonB
MLKKITALHIAIAISVILHVALVTLRFVDPAGFNRIFEDTPLEVVLVNARSNEAPSKAQAIAQANLEGGGEAASGLATSPLALLTEIGDASENLQKQIEEFQEVQKQQLTQLRRDLAALSATDRLPSQTEADRKAQEELRRQLLQQLAVIEKRINEENARPKRRFITPATREAEYALYYDQLRRKIEDRGTRNFPESQGRRLYGELTVMVTVDALGRVLETEVVKSSGNNLLDKRSIAIVQAAAPFGAFSPEMRKKADQLVVTSRFRYSRNEGLETTLTGQ